MDPFTVTDVDPRVTVDVADSVISMVLDALVEIETFSASLVLKTTVDGPLLVDCSPEVEFSGRTVAIDCSELELLITDVEFSVNEAIDTLVGWLDDEVDSEPLLEVDSVDVDVEADAEDGDEDDAEVVVLLEELGTEVDSVDDDVEIVDDSVLLGEEGDED